MKGIELLLIGMLVVLFAIAVPAAYGYVDIEKLVPSDTQEVEAGAGEAYIGLMSAPVFSNDTARIERLLPSSSATVETGAGETPWVLMEPAKFSHDNFKIERLLPAD